MGASADPFLTAREAGIHPIVVPTPFGVGPVNAYLIEDDPLVLVDSGPNHALALSQLEGELRRLGHSVEDIGLLVITHHHFDHLGLTAVIADRSGAEVAAIAGARGYVEDFGRQSRADSAFAAHLLCRHGVDPRTAAVFRTGNAESAAWGSETQLSLPLADGADLALRDRTLRADHRPGHSPTDTVFTDNATGIAFTGDHLIGHISPNPLITRPLGTALDYDGSPPDAMLDLRDSLRATAAAAPTLALTGHGDPVEDVAGLIDQRLAAHDRRAGKLLELLATGPRSAHSLSVAIWGEQVFEELFLTLCEVLGHLDLLASRGLVATREVRDGVVYELVDGS
jgi:glyoxylase-like metal-dependent hydrolase (beta-lactamase superfamily II)